MVYISQGKNNVFCFPSAGINLSIFIAKYLNYQILIVDLICLWENSDFYYGDQTIDIFVLFHRPCGGRKHEM
jgi:hypothetical protein